MKKLLIAIFGEENAEKPASKAITYAVLATAAALILALLVLIISSIVFAVSNNSAEAPAEGGEGEEGKGGTKIEYATADIDDLKAKLDPAVNIKDNRTSIEGGFYYGTKSPSTDTLAKSAMTNIDQMFVDFYNAKKNELVISNADESTCNIPLLIKADGLYSVKIVPYNQEESSIAGKDLYKWIYDNAAKYGFVYEGNTFTYVGKTAAAKGINALKSSTADSPIGTTNSKCYFIKADATNIKVPTNYEYTVTAYTDGYIVTVDLSKKVTK